MSVYTVIKKTGASNSPTTMDYSTIQSFEDDAPADLTTSEKSASTTFVGTFSHGEALSFVGSGATGVFVETDQSSYIVYGISSGNPSASDVVTGGTSGAVCTLTSGTPTNVGIIYKGECYNQGNLAGVNVSGETTSTSCFVWISAHAGASFRDNASVRTNPLFPDGTKGILCTVTNNYGHCFDISANNTMVSYLQIQNLGAAGALGFQNSGHTIDSCICRSNADAIIGAATYTFTLINSLFISNTTFGGNSNGITGGNVYNCTVVNIGTSTGIGMTGNGAAASRNHHNTAFFGFAQMTAGVNGGTSDYAATDASSATEGAHTVTGLVKANQFVSGTADYRAVATGGLKAGTPDATNAPVDITGQTRDATTPYIGCWEVVSGGSTTNASLIMTQAQAALLFKKTSTSLFGVQAQQPVQQRQINVIHLLKQAVAVVFAAMRIVPSALFGKQSMVAIQSRQAQLIHVATQAQAGVSARATRVTELATQAQQIVKTRMVNVTHVTAQSVVAILGAIKVILRTLFATQAAVAIQQRAVNVIHVMGQAQAAVSARAVSVKELAKQTQQALIVKQAQLIKVCVQAEAAILGAIRVVLKALFATQASVAIQARAVRVANVAAQAQVALQQRLVSITRVVGQAVSVVFAAVYQAAGTLTHTFLVTQAAVVTQVRALAITHALAQASQALQARAVNRVAVATQTMTAALTKQVNVIKICAQATALVFAAIKVILHTFLLAQATALTVSRAMSTNLRAQQAQALVWRRAMTTALLAQQAQQATSNRLIRTTMRAVQRVVAFLTSILPGAPTPRIIYLNASLSNSFTLNASFNTTKFYNASE